jgi:hypothetical protein
MIDEFKGIVLYYQTTSRESQEIDKINFLFKIQNYLYNKIIKTEKTTHSSCVRVS